MAVVVPAGPNDDVVDTVASVLHFSSAPRFVVVVDDTGGNVRRDLEALSPDVSVIPAPPAAGAHGGLWVKVAAGYRHVLRHFAFDVLLRIDADALVIGGGVAEAAARRFATDAAVGMLGSYRVGPDGRLRSWSDAARALRRECGLPGWQHPRTRRVLRTLRKSAEANRYVAGEHPLGGAYLHSFAAAHAIAERGWLDLDPLRYSRLGEDHLFGLVTVAAGFEIADFGGPEDPLALRWRGLPDDPAALLARNKLVTHSVRSFGDLDERAIRSIFAEARR
ncbi:MAG TPA: hypothetical protein VMD59_09285 [Acidimicrobiales bacterium]|nr:hypothetical protein [Acidimicrobiales bacterium]